MYRFLMVDDEEIVRRGFQRKIDWTSLGFEFLEPCENGEQAIAAMDALRPDVVMTDIAMPRMDGLAVAAYAAEHHQETVVVILSGYDEFEYAQKAIRSNVFEYVLKPVTSRDLAALLSRLKDRLDSVARTREEARAVEERAQAASALLRSRVLLDLVTGSAETPSAERFQDLFGFSPEGLCCSVIIVDRVSGGEGPFASEGLAAVVDDVAGAPRRALAFTLGGGREACLVLGQDEASCERLAGAIGGKVVAAAGPSAIVGIGGPRRTWREAPRSFLEASAALSYLLVAPQAGAFRYERASEDDPRTREGLAELRERARRAVVAGETEEARTQAAAYLALLNGAGISPQRVRHEVEALFASVLDALRNPGVSPEALARDLGRDADIAVQRLRTAEDVLALLDRLAACAGSLLGGRALPAPEWKVRDFKDYVARHYGERALSVQTIAASLSISASYLSKLVKRHLDRSVVDYLIDYRMERAKELLAASDLMMYEIAEATGYPDAQYFSTVFKRQIGITPTEFRSQRRRKSPSA